MNDDVLQKPHMVWCPDDTDEDSAVSIVALASWEAAERFVEANWANFDHAETLEIHVRHLDGTLRKYQVYARQEVRFDACRLDDEEEEDSL